MAVEHRYANKLAKTQSRPAEKMPAWGTGSPVRQWLDSATIENGDSGGSTYTLARLPSGALLSPIARLYHDAVSGAGTLTLGDAQYPTALLAGHSLGSSGSVDLMGSIPAAELGKPLWALLGHESDPAGDIDLIATISGTASASGVLTLQLTYSGE